MDVGPVVVTGAGRGIGLAVAESFARRGITVAALARSMSGIGPLAEKFDNITAFEVDVTDEDSVGDTAKKVRRGLGVARALVTCAAAPAASGPSEHVSLHDWNSVIDCDLTGTFLVNRDFGAGMVEARYGRIVNVTSFHTVATYPERAAYVAAKSGVEGLVSALAVEWGGRGVTVNSVAPGPIRTPRTQFFLDANPENEAGMIGRTPIGRIGEVEDVVAAIEFLTSPKAGFITGQRLVVDGGWTRNAWWGRHQLVT